MNFVCEAPFPIVRLERRGGRVIAHGEAGQQMIVPIHNVEERALLRGPEGRAEGTPRAERSGDHSPTPDATTVAGNKSSEA